MFIWNDGDLNSEQEAAIFETDSVFLTACPGSGKTRTLTYKIAFELSRLQSSKQFVVAITYTNRAADRQDLGSHLNYQLFFFSTVIAQRW